MNIFDAVILGIVEGLTEFLPVSSTGHMILAAKLMGLQQTDTLKCFEVVIQLGSILAVVAMFYKRLLVDFKLWCKLVVGFIPTAAIGFLLYKSIKSLFAPQIVAYALIGWGIIFIAVELFRKARPKENELEHTFRPSSSGFRNVLRWCRALRVAALPSSQGFCAG